MRRFDAVFCDVDGCLMPELQVPSDVPALGEIAAYNRLATEMQDRPAVVPCTGRPLAYCEAVCRLIGAGTFPAIAEHGAWIYDFKANRWALSPDITRDDLAAGDELRAWVERELGARGCFLQVGKVAGVTIFHEDVPWLEAEVVPMVRDLVAERGWAMRVSTTWSCINVDLVHVDKGRAIERVIERCGLTRERLAGVGDTEGDLAIREKVAFFACPANAREGIKRHADFVAESDEARGVVEILERLVTGDE
jgi:hydroxymethylpyrimidine pyrophosphatase-like HAD family hydrolase